MRYSEYCNPMEIFLYLTRCATHAHSFAGSQNALVICFLNSRNINQLENSVKFTGTVKKMIPTQRRREKKSELRSEREREWMRHKMNDNDDLISFSTLGTRVWKKNNEEKIWQILIQFWWGGFWRGNSWFTLIEFEIGMFNQFQLLYFPNQWALFDWHHHTEVIVICILCVFQMESTLFQYKLKNDKDFIHGSYKCPSLSVHISPCFFLFFVVAAVAIFIFRVLLYGLFG